MDIQKQLQELQSERQLQKIENTKEVDKSNSVSSTVSRNISKFLLPLCGRVKHFINKGKN